jgi:hypothetical protein
VFTAKFVLYFLRAAGRTFEVGSSIEQPKPLKISSLLVRVWEAGAGKAVVLIEVEAVSLPIVLGSGVKEYLDRRSGAFDVDCRVGNGQSGSISDSRDSIVAFEARCRTTGDGDGGSTR